jgi:hypothetical protein
VNTTSVRGDADELCCTTQILATSVSYLRYQEQLSLEQGPQDIQAGTAAQCLDNHTQHTVRRSGKILSNFLTSRWIKSLRC